MRRGSFAGERGSGKTTLARLFRKLLPEGGAFVTVPLNVTEDALLGTIDVEATIKTGVATVQRGLLSRAHDGVIFIDDVNLLSSESVSLVLETSGRKENIIEREGLSTRHPADFILLSTMDPEEGLLSPHLLDRFGMCVFWKSVSEKTGRIMIVKKAMADISASMDTPIRADAALRERIKNCGKFLEQRHFFQRCDGLYSQNMPGKTLFPGTGRTSSFFTRQKPMLHTAATQRRPSTTLTLLRRLFYFTAKEVSCGLKMKNPSSVTRRIKSRKNNLRRNQNRGGSAQDSTRKREDGHSRVLCRRMNAIAQITTHLRVRRL